MISRKLAFRLWPVVLVWLAACTTVDIGPPPAIDRGAKWVLLPIMNHTETPQAGLRAESSIYSGALIDRDSSFTIAYPISLFPSVFLTRQIGKGDQVQLAYTRRINRPNFFQTMPFTDFTDSLNLRRGNPQLIPEFTNSLELSYQHIFKKGNLLMSAYFKQATNLITTYQFAEYDATTGKELVITSYELLVLI